jgi:hypothetical protein
VRARRDHPAGTKPLTSGANADGPFDKRDEYRCPAEKRAIDRYASEEDGMKVRRYWTSECETCKIKNQCTLADDRKIRRWEHEDVLE